MRGAGAGCVVEDTIEFDVLGEPALNAAAALVLQLLLDQRAALLQERYGDEEANLH